MKRGLLALLTGLLFASPALANRMSDAARVYFANDNLAPTDPLSPTWAWDDITTTGTPIWGFYVDDSISSALPIGFTFRFYGTDYTQAYVSSNGFLTFPFTFNSGCCSGSTIPQPFDPNAFVAFYWTDLVSGSGTGTYQTLGTAPNRRFVVEYANWDCYGARGSLRTMEIVLFETTNLIEVRYQTDPACGSYTAVAGIENTDGTDGIQWQYGSGLVIPDMTVVRYSSDRDGDGIPDLVDVCPDDPVAAHQDPAVCDDDGDGIPNVSDNCVSVANPLQEDCDGDGIGDVCDPDMDNDGTPNAQDCGPCDPAVHPGVMELCNLVDDDCNGIVDDTPPLTCGVGGCAVTVDPSCAGGVVLTCTPTSPMPEICNRIDDDCNGLVDEGLTPACSVPCSFGTDCPSGFCADGVCCDSACTDPCHSCNLAGAAGTCTIVPAGQDPRNDCVDLGGCATACDGTGACQTTCLDLGVTCATDSQCLSRHCVSGVCCATSCTALCHRCDDPSALGACISVANGLSCDDGEPCNGAETCFAGRCERGTPLPEGGRCDDGNLCTPAGICVAGHCNAPPDPMCDDRDPCTTDSCAPESGCVHAAIAGCMPPAAAGGCHCGLVGARVDEARAARWPGAVLALLGFFAWRRRRRTGTQA